MRDNANRRSFSRGRVMAQRALRRVTTRSRPRWYSMDLRVLAIALPLWVLIGPAVCAAACGPSHSMGLPASAVEHGTTADTHHSHANYEANSKAGLGCPSRAACTDPISHPAIDCCDETATQASQQQTAPRSTVPVTLTAHPTRSISERFPFLDDPKRLASPNSPYSCANPPLLI